MYKWDEVLMLASLHVDNYDFIDFCLLFGGDSRPQVYPTVYWLPTRYTLFQLLHVRCSICSRRLHNRSNEDN